MAPSSLEQMRSDWEQRARADARHFIACDEARGLSFGLSGLRDAVAILQDVHPYLDERARVLEIGCGIGRLMQFMALLFAEAHGVDIAPAMIEQARSFLARHPNAHPALCDGAKLDAYPDAHFDFVYSYVVFQHIPDKEVVRSYVREARRVLRPGGVFKYLVKVQPWREGGNDSWHGVDISRADVDAWNDELGFELLNAYSNVEPSTAWVLVRVPKS